jgi:hypothetical protein
MTLSSTSRCFGVSSVGELDVEGSLDALGDAYAADALVPRCLTRAARPEAAPSGMRGSILNLSRSATTELRSTGVVGTGTPP